MQDDPRTRDSLLVRIADATDDDAWLQFVAIYEPVVYRIARRKGLQDADARDLVQHVMASVSRSIDRWQPDSDRASFRTWLYRVANNAIVDFVRKKKPDDGQGGTSILQALLVQPDHDAIAETEWETAHRREVFRWAARRIIKEFTDSTWAAFALTTIEGMSPADAAERLGMTVGSIYTARSRVMRRLRDEVQCYE
jgi:RNA polymerase sigma-70 factor (ECF subfamily)